MSEEKNISQDENLKDENISSDNSVTKTTQSLTKLDMEVHAHSHAGHRKKNFKEYFLEFLMIFLAVTGFLQLETHKK